MARCINLCTLHLRSISGLQALCCLPARKGSNPCPPLPSDQQTTTICQRPTRASPGCIFRSTPPKPYSGRNSLWPSLPRLLALSNGPRGLFKGRQEIYSQHWTFTDGAVLSNFSLSNTTYLRSKLLALYRLLRLHQTKHFFLQHLYLWLQTVSYFIPLV